MSNIKCNACGGTGLLGEERWSLPGTGIRCGECNGTGVLGVVLGHSHSDPDRNKPLSVPDKGAHYRYSFKGVKFDPYRVCKLYGIEGGPREHMTKKLLRGSGKGHSEEDLIKELQCCLDRWKEMIEEDK
jgi:hypothetical protein